MLFLSMSQCDVPWGWVCWGTPLQPGGVLCRDTQVSVMQASSRTANSRAETAPGQIRGEKCITSCAGFASVVVTAFRSKVAVLPDTTLYCVLRCKPSIANLVDFCEDILPFDCRESFLWCRRKVEGFQESRDLSLAKEGTQILQSRHSMEWWNHGQILHLLSRPWPSVGRAGVRSREEEKVMQVKGLPHARGLGALQSTRSGLCYMACRGMMISTSLRMWGAWLQTECSHSHLVQVRCQSVRLSSAERAQVPRFPWKSGTCVISGNCSSCLSSSTVNCERFLSEDIQSCSFTMSQKWSWGAKTHMSNYIKTAQKT